MFTDFIRGDNTVVILNVNTNRPFVSGFIDIVETVYYLKKHNDLNFLETWTKVQNIEQLRTCSWNVYGATGGGGEKTSNVIRGGGVGRVNHMCGMYVRQ